MNNYFNFTKLIQDKESFKYFNSLSSNILKNILNDSFNYVDNYINEYALTFQKLLNKTDYDEYYYSCKVLSETLNEIKIILIILMGRNQ